MTDLLDRRIRTLMTHVADASPDAPSTDQIEARRAVHQGPLSEGATPSELLLERRPARAVGLGGGLRRRRPAWVAVAAAMVVMVAVGGVAWLLTRSQESVPPVLSQPESITSLPVPTTTPEATVAGPVMSWQQVPSQASLGADDADHEFVMHTVITGGPGLIAGGQVRPVIDSDSYFNWPISGTEATIWTSEDGVTWDRVPPEVSGLDGPGGYMIHDLTIGGPGYIAVGAALEDGQRWPHAAVWVSADARSWDRVESPSFLDEAMFAVAAGDRGIVAVWGDAWYSPDGFEWQRAETPAGFSALGTGSAWDVADADWGYVAVGTKNVPGEQDQDESGEGGHNQKPYAWISQDGLSWDGVDLHPTEEWTGAEVWSVIARGNEVVVAGSLAQTYGSYFDAPPVFWTTSDGSLWSEHALDPVPVPGMTKPEAVIEGLAETDSGMVAVGSWVHRSQAPGDEGSSRAAVWATSTGNSTWTGVSGGDTFGEGSWMWDVAVLDGVVFGVGDNAGDAAVWVGEWID